MSQHVTSSETNEIPEVTVGFDIGDRYSHLFVLEASGEIVETSRVSTTPKMVQRYFEGKDRMRVVMEVGTHSPWISRLVGELGHEVIVANPRKLRMIYENENKDDDIDAEMLARVGRMDPKLLYPIRHRGEQTQQALAIVRSRDALVGVRTKLINHVRGAIKVVGTRIAKCSSASFHKQAAASLPDGLKPALGPIVSEIERMSAQIKAYDALIATACKEVPEAQVLQQVAGVGPVTALTFVLTLEDPSRFPNGRSVGAYLGLCPGRRQSGDGDPQLRIHKRGDTYLRSLLVGSAQYILGPFGPDTDLRRWGLKQTSRGGKAAKKRAAVAVARKLSVLLYRLWVSGATYEPLYNASRSQAAAA